MDYVRYYAELIRANGVPQISISAHQKLFNLFILESKARENERWGKIVEGSTFERQFKMTDLKLKGQVHNITNGLKPKEFIKSLLEEHNLNN